MGVGWASVTTGTASRRGREAGTLGDVPVAVPAPWPPGPWSCLVLACVREAAALHGPGCVLMGLPQLPLGLEGSPEARLPHGAVPQPPLRRGLSGEGDIFRLHLPRR